MLKGFYLLNRSHLFSFVKMSFCSLFFNNIILEVLIATEPFFIVLFAESSGFIKKAVHAAGINAKMSTEGWTIRDIICNKFTQN